MIGLGPGNDVGPWPWVAILGLDGPGLVDDTGLPPERVTGRTEPTGFLVAVVD